MARHMLRFQRRLLQWLMPLRRRRVKVQKQSAVNLRQRQKQIRRVFVFKGGRREKLQSSTLILELQASPGPEVARRRHTSAHCAAAATVVCLTCCLNSRSQVESVASRLSTQASWSLSKETQAHCRGDNLSPAAQCKSTFKSSYIFKKATL